MRLPNLQDLTSRCRPSPGAPGIDALVAHADPRAAFEDRLRWLAGVMQWVSGSRRILSLGPKGAITSLPEARLRYLLQLLDRNPEWKTRAAGPSARSCATRTRWSCCARRACPQTVAS